MFALCEVILGCHQNKYVSFLICSFTVCSCHLCCMRLSTFAVAEWIGSAHPRSKYQGFSEIRRLIILYLFLHGHKFWWKISGKKCDGRRRTRSFLSCTSLELVKLFGCLCITLNGNHKIIESRLQNSENRNIISAVNKSSPFSYLFSDCRF